MARGFPSWETSAEAFSIMFNAWGLCFSDNWSIIIYYIYDGAYPKGDLAMKKNELIRLGPYVITFANMQTLALLHHMENRRNFIIWGKKQTFCSKKNTYFNKRIPSWIKAQVLSKFYVPWKSRISTLWILLLLLRNLRLIITLNNISAHTMIACLNGKEERRAG